MLALLPHGEVPCPPLVSLHCVSAHLPLSLLAHPLEGVLQLLLLPLHIPLGLPGCCHLLGHLRVLAMTERELSDPRCWGDAAGKGDARRGVEEPTFRSRSAWFCTSSLYFSFSLV